MKALAIAFILVFVVSSKSLSQGSLKPKVWIGIWDYRLKYEGAYQIDSILFDPKLQNSLNDFRVEDIQEKIKSESVWHYIMVASDSIEIIETDSLMKKIEVTDYEYKWRFEYNGPQSYLKESEHPPTLEFLPDGHWLYFSTEKGKVGIFLEKYVKDHKLNKFSKSYDLKTGLVDEYFEIENGLLNGITYFKMGNGNRIKAILRYKDGVLVESLYDRNH